MDVKPIGVRLLDLLDAKVGVDMLSGTSPGGINGRCSGRRGRPAVPHRVRRADQRCGRQTGKTVRRKPCPR
ncbi:hypothetical protein ACRAWF_03645 [Streptomyces sp. L7]